MKILLLLSLNLLYFVSSAQDPIGLWKTIDDETGNAKSHIEIYEEDGKLFGKVTELLEDAKTTICDKCSGDNKDQPIVGMIVLKNLIKDGEEWNSGKILDPNNGKTYSVFLTLENKNKLKVRGYIGFSLLGRTQYWYRLEG